MLLPLLLSTLAAAPAAGQEPPAPIQEATPQAAAAEALARLQAEVEASELGSVEKRETFGPRYQEIADSWPGTDAALDAELEIFNSLWYVKDASQRGQMAMARLDHLLDVYAEHKGLQRLAQMAYNFDRAQLAEALDRVAAASPHREVDAAMLWGKLRVMRGEEREALLKKAAKEYGELKWREATYAELADAHLNPHSKEALAVGQPAPEIVGVDLDGRPMKLSDFRGKVVVLDFWGDW